LKFCSECNTVLTLDAKRRLLVCSKCGHEEPSEGPILRELRTLPQTKIKCPKCENLMAEWWMVQTRSIDESATQFFRCTKCRHTWRDYG